MYKEIRYSLVFVAVLPLACHAEGAKKIQDNSFLVEEAYNQEAGVVQHIQNVMYNQRTKDWFYTFTVPPPRVSYRCVAEVQSDEIGCAD